MAVILTLLGLATLEASHQGSFWEGGIERLLRLVRLAVPGILKVAIAVVSVKIMVSLVLGNLWSKGRKVPNLLGLVILEASQEGVFGEGGVESLLRLVRLVIPEAEPKGIVWKVVGIVFVRILGLLALGILQYKGRQVPTWVHQIEAVNWVLLSLAFVWFLLV